ncbi:hypothetical protein AB0L65_48210 [Nonomuraea sp. NPDC052116]|uniref:hypothetical protein n=1 Tax=Nonomuraea sp. NPDC052116 TaxID=3155665 RepID=UPI00342E6276
MRQWHDPDPEAVLTDPENGADSLWLAVALGDLSRVLDGVHLDWISIVLDAGRRTKETVNALLSPAAARGVPAGSLRAVSGQTRSARTRESRSRDVTRRKAPVVGVMFPPPASRSLVRVRQKHSHFPVIRKPARGGSHR